MKRKFIVIILIALMAVACMSFVACEKSTEGLEFTKIEGKEEYAVTGIGTATDDDIVIPEEYNGLPVTSIGDNAFYNSSIISVTIPDSVTSIGIGAFLDCCHLRDVTIGSGVARIDYKAFYDCYRLASIVVSDENSFFHSEGNCLIETESKTLILGCKNSVIPNDGSVTSIGDRAFTFCHDLASITIPDGVTSIGEHAFDFCQGLVSLTIPGSVTTIGDFAFSRCIGLMGVTIESGVTSIGRAAFEGCYKLVGISIPDSVTYIGRAAFSDCSKLIYNIKDNLKYLGNSYNPHSCLVDVWPRNITSAIIDDNCKVIAGEAFNDCSKLRSVTLPDSVIGIGDYAFKDCSFLDSVTIGSGVTNIGENAFSGVWYNASIYYNGTAEEWNKISISDKNGSLKSSTIYYYSLRQPTVDGKYWHYDRNDDIVVW